MASEMPVNYSIDLLTCDVSTAAKSGQFRVFWPIFPFGAMV
jgi:hypothetical protein